MRKLLTLAAIAVIISIAAIAQRGFAELQQLAKKGDVTAMEELAHKYDSVGNKEEAMKWTEKASKKGSLEAKYRLAMAYIKGEGKGVDKEKGGKLLREAALAGNINAQVAMAEYSTNQANTIKWYLTAALAGDCYSTEKMLEYESDIPEEYVDLYESIKPKLDSLKVEKKRQEDERNRLAKERQMAEQREREIESLFNKLKSAYKRTLNDQYLAQLFWEYAEGKSPAGVDSLFAVAKAQSHEENILLTNKLKQIRLQGKEASLGILINGSFVDSFSAKESGSDQVVVYKHNGKLCLGYEDKVVASGLDNVLSFYTGDSYNSRYPRNTYLLELIKDGSIAIYDIRSKQLVVPFGKYTNIEKVEKGVSVTAKVNGKKLHGFCKYEKGWTEVIPPLYSKVQVNRYTYSVWDERGKIGIYNNVGKLIIPCGKYTSIGKKNYSLVEYGIPHEWIIVYNGKKMGLVDFNTGKQLVPPIYDSFPSSASGGYVFIQEYDKDHGKMVVYDKTGKILVTKDIKPGTSIYQVAYSVNRLIGPCSEPATEYI